jgi:hypothetical protein
VNEVSETRLCRQIVAKKLAMSTRTLAWRLASEGTTFEEVVDEFRRTLALQYVKTPNVSLSHVAWLLGYEGSTSFNHAFKRWTGGFTLGGARPEPASGASIGRCSTSLVTSPYPGKDGGQRPTNVDWVTRRREAMTAEFINP